MKLIGITYKNTQIDDLQTFKSLPEVLQQFLKEVNGLIAFKGGLHIRGCCMEPSWHSIQEAWTGKYAFWKNYPDILDIDIPFAQDCMGDQYLMRSERIIKLYSETGEVDFLNLSFIDFLKEIEKDPLQFLGLQPLIQFEMDGKTLEPGRLLNAYPPFCMRRPASEVALKDLPAEEQLQFLATLSKQIRRSREGDEDNDDINFIVG